MAWKLAIGFGIIAAALILVTGFILISLDSASTAVTPALVADVATIDKARGLHELLNEEERNAQKFLVTRDPAYLRMYSRTRLLALDRLDSLETVLNDTIEFATLEDLERIYRAMTAPPPSLD